MIGKTGPEVIKHFFMLNSAEHENFSANKYENANYLLAEKFSCSAMFLKKEFAIVSNLRFICRTKFMLSWVEHEKSIITSGSDFMDAQADLSLLTTPVCLRRLDPWLSSKDDDQTTWMHILICVFTWCTYTNFNSSNTDGSFTLTESKLLF